MIHGQGKLNEFREWLSVRIWWKWFSENLDDSSGCEYYFQNFADMLQMIRVCFVNIFRPNRVLSQTWSISPFKFFEYSNLVIDYGHIYGGHNNESSIYDCLLSFVGFFHWSLPKCFVSCDLWFVSKCSVEILNLKIDLELFWFRTFQTKTHFFDGSWVESLKNLISVADHNLWWTFCSWSK